MNSTTATSLPGDGALLEAHRVEAREDRRIGFWFYVVGDAVIFALLFATYAAMVDRTAGGPAGRELFDLRRAFAESMLLLASSFTFAIAGLQATAGRPRGVVACLGATFVLGVAFLVLEVGEFAGMIGRGAGPDRSGFLSAFFALVGTHGLHVTAGLVWVLVMGGQVLRGGMNAAVSSRIERLGIFWHFLDIIWIAIFTFVYLAGMLR
jgi:cytochrome o ubiquinol oxidase subunit 3